LCRGKVCTQDERAQCELVIEDLEWACKNCPKRRIETISPWVWHLLWLRRLQRGGYPFEANDLSLEEWEDLGLANEVIEASEKEGLLRIFG
jgi:hypothetical protein